MGFKPKFPNSTTSLGTTEQYCIESNEINAGKVVVRLITNIESFSA